MEAMNEKISRRDSAGSDLKQERKMLMAEEKVASLQDVIKQLQMTKKYLHLNAVEVKANIHSNMSRLLEALRTREVWLLNQVDVILQAKDERLRGQEDQLNQALGRLTNCLNIMDDGGTALDVELMEILQRNSFLEKHPVESPHVSFRADMGGLRQAIHQFGRVDSKGLPLEAFASPHLRSSSLPKAFEDYEDDEHHILYKSIHEIHEKQHGKSIVFNIPKLTTDIPSWVSPVHLPTMEREKKGYSEGASCSSTDATVFSKPSTIPYYVPKPPSTVFSVDQWMQEIGMEEEDDDVISSQLSENYGRMEKPSFTSGQILAAGSKGKQMPRRGESPLLTSSVQSDWLAKKTEGKIQIGSSPLKQSAAALQLEDWLIGGGSRLPLKSAKQEVTVRQSQLPATAAIQPFSFKPMVEAAAKESVLDGYIRKIAALPRSFWLAPSAESPKLESETGSGLLENYAKKISSLPWLASYKRLPGEAGPTTEGEATENRAKRSVTQAWLAKEHLPKDPCAVAQPELPTTATEGFLENYQRRMASASWLPAGNRDPEPDHCNTFFSDHIKRASSLPLSHWLLPRHDDPGPADERPVNPCAPDDAEPTQDDDRLNESHLHRKEKPESVSESVISTDYADAVEKYFNVINSRPTSAWLLPSPAEEDFDLS